jgi:hypothetical protein
MQGYREVGTQRIRGRDELRVPYILSAALAALMVVQSGLGLLFQGQYRDVEWIKATWFGNDWVTLLFAVPLLVVALLIARGGSVPSLLLWLGLIGYGVYNYAYYYLLVLSVNSIVGVHRGLAKTPGEFPMWSMLAIFTTAVSLLLLANTRHQRTSFSPR